MLGACNLDYTESIYRQKYSWTIGNICYYNSYKCSQMLIDSGNKQFGDLNGKFMWLFVNYFSFQPIFSFVGIIFVPVLWDWGIK